MNEDYPRLGYLKIAVEVIEEESFKDDDNPMKEIFGTEDDNDKTLVFDYINEEWFEYVYSNIEKVYKSNLYAGDGSVLYKIAFICIDINLLHRLPNGNKRSSLLVLFILLMDRMGRDFPFSLDWKYMYTFSKKVAEKGNKNREENIEELRKYLENSFEKVNNIL